MPEPTETAYTLTPPQVPAATMTLSVNADGSGDYASLEDAIEAAAEGAAIQLAPGTYHIKGALRLTRSIQLLGSGMDTTMIMTDFTTAVPAAVTSSGEWFVARDLTFRYVGDGGTDLVWAQGEHSVVERCRFQGAKPLEDTGPALGAGLRIGAGEAYVVDSEFKENVFGLLMEFDARGVVRGNTARGNGVGLGVFGEGRPILMDNTTEGNDLGIGVFGQAQPRLEGNLSVGNQQAGISVAEQASPTVIRNRTLRNDAFGIAYADTAGGSASGNECSQNQAGIFVSDQAQPVLESNRCNENLVAGIAYSDNARGRAQANVCAENPFGIWIRGEASPELIDNQCPDKSQSDEGD
jgi:parallel beta-helix repeat protein